MTIPGVGHYSTLLVSSEIADVDRFPDPEHLCSYARLSPGVHQSGDTQYTFSGAGNSMLNWIMIQCTHVHVRRCDSAITRFYQQGPIKSAASSEQLDGRFMCSPGGTLDTIPVYA